MNTKPRATRSNFFITAIASLSLILLAQPAMSDPVEIIYEPFDYDTGTVGGQDGGIGMTGSWSQTADREEFEVVSDGLSFGALPVEGNSIRRTSAPGSAEINREISAASQAALTADNTTIWFSILLWDQRFATDHENGTFAFTSGPFTSTGGNWGALPNVAGGDGFGVTTRLNEDFFQIFAYRIQNGSQQRSSDYHEGSTTAGGTYLVVGKIDWGEDNEGHTLHLFNITDPEKQEPPDESTAFASFTADFDQSTLDTLAIANQQVSGYDEIRFATTFAAALGLEEPSPAGSVFIIK